MKHLWLVWFAILSGLEEAMNGKHWKIITSLILGTVVYLVIEQKLIKKK